MDMDFFAADEFQGTGFFIYRLYEASFGAAPRFIDFNADRKLLERYRVNELGDPLGVIAAQRSFVESWTRRAAFRAVYPDTMSAEKFVDQLFDRAQLKASTQERKRQIDALNAGKSRAELLREIIETDEFKRRENDRALVLMQFLLQLRRDVDYKDERYKGWLEKLDRHEPVDTRHVICLFLTSEEYQRRFGPVVTHNNTECR